MKFLSIRSLSLLVIPILFAGCKLLGEEFVAASLEEMMSGAIPSTANRYRVPAPRIAAIRKNTGIIREGSLFVIIVGPDLKKNVKQHGTRGVEYGVRLRKEPRTHLVLEKIFASGEEINLFEGNEKLRAEFPQLVSSSDIPFTKFTPDAALTSVGPDDDRRLSELGSSRRMISGFGIEKRPLPESAVDPVKSVFPECRTDRPQFVLTSDGCDWVVVKGDVTTYLMLDFLIVEERNFKGGVVFTSAFDRTLRRETDLGGTVRVRWIDLGGTLFFKAP